MGRVGVTPFFVGILCIVFFGGNGVCVKAFDVSGVVYGEGGLELT